MRNAKTWNEVWPICPICGEECETLYRDRWGFYVGCDICVETKDAWEWMEEQRHE